MIDHIWEFTANGGPIQVEDGTVIHLDNKGQDICEVCGILRIKGVSAWRSLPDGSTQEYFETVYLINVKMADDDPGCKPSIIHLAKKYQDARSG